MRAIEASLLSGSELYREVILDKVAHARESVLIATANVKDMHVEGRSIRSLLADPQAAWSLPGVTTFGYQNHTVRTEQWRYIRYADGSGELYDHNNDPYEWTNLINRAESDPVRAELAKFLPQTNVRGPQQTVGGLANGGGSGKQAEKSLKGREQR